MHLTDDQLNEYLDDESNQREHIELHLSACADCAARYSALQALSAEIESLPDVEFSPRLAARHLPSPSLPAQLPRSLTLTVTLQAALAVIAAIVAAPFVMQFVSPYVPDLSTPTPADLVLRVQSLWVVWLNALSQIQLPTIPQIPVVEIPNLSGIFMLIGVSLLWLIGNGLLLKNQIK